MTPIDLDEDDHTAERADVALLHDLTVAHNADRYPPSGTPGRCHYHAIPYEHGICTACAEEHDYIDRYDSHYSWRWQRTNL